MRKSIIRVAAIALAVVMLSTCVITSIIAAYKASDNCNVTATQSAFNVTVEITEGNTADLTLIPGGSGTLASVAVTTPENAAPSVPVTISYTVEAFTIKGFSDTYCPIVITVGENDYSMTGEITTVALLEAAVKNAIEALDADGNYEEATKAFAISWAWTSGASDKDITNAEINLKMIASVDQAITPAE